MSDNELIVIPTETALQVFTTPAGLDPYLAQVRAEIDAFVPDLSSKKGRDAYDVTWPEAPQGEDK